MRNGKTRSTVIISLPPQALQYEVVRRGVVIESQIYGARHYNNGLQVKQCFNCQQWGHTQSACGKRARCGECASSHQTKECTKENVVRKLRKTHTGRGRRANAAPSRNTWKLLTLNGPNSSLQQRVYEAQMLRRQPSERMDSNW